MIDGRHYYAHRIVWLHTKGWLPKQDLDHRDGDKTRCATANLRPASKPANNRNRQSSTKQNPAPRGSWFNTRTRKFQAYIETSEAGARQRIFLGSNATAEAAVSTPVES
jgi:HNH endonuclease